MTALPEYHPLDRKLAFTARVEVAERTPAAAVSTALSYDLRLQPAARQGWGAYCLQIDRSAARYETRSSNPADEVVTALAAPLGLVEMMLDGRGEPTGLRNHALIWKRWKEETRPAVIAGYSGPWVDAVVAKTERQLLHPEAVIAALITRDPILQQYFAAVHRAATGGSAFLFHLAGRPVPLQEAWSATANGGRAIRIEAAFAGREPSTRWNALLPPAQRTDGDAEPPRIAKRGDFFLLPGSLWCAGFDCRYDIRFGADYEKNIRLQLSPQ